MVMTLESGARQCPFLIESFCDYTSQTQSPLLFRKWAVVSAIAGALERKVWLRVAGRTLFPNMYILLTGGPGIGKTDALRGVTQLWSELPDLHIAPTSVSRASLTDELAEAARSLLRPAEGSFEKFNALQVCAEEFGTFLSQYETEFMSTLNHLYDCVAYKEKKRHMKEPIVIPSPYLNMIAATTPAWLSGTLPETAWAEGFSSRLLMIYSGERIKVDLFAERKTDNALFAKIVSDLQSVHQMWGQMSFAPDVVEAMQAWYALDCPPIPDHPKLEHYLPRRHIHFLKLCIVMSAARGEDMVLRMIDYQRAMEFFIEAEASMPDVFKAMKYNSDTNVIDECYNFVWTAFAKEQKAVPEHRIIHFLSQRAPTHSITKILETMVQAGILDLASIGERGRNTYKPAPKSSF